MGDPGAPSWRLLGGPWGPLGASRVGSWSPVGGSNVAAGKAAGASAARRQSGKGPGGVKGADPFELSVASMLHEQWVQRFLDSFSLSSDSFHTSQILNTNTI